MSVANLLKGITGQPEIGRTALAVGGVFSVITPILFEIYEIGWNGGHFDVTAWCLAYPGGLGLLVTGGIWGIGNKDKQVAAAQVTRDTGALPAQPVTP